MIIGRMRNQIDNNIHFYITHMGALAYSIDIFKEVYTSIIISLSFFAAFAIIMPFLTGISITFMLNTIVVVFIIVEAGVLVYLKSVAPDDPVWQTSGELTSVDW